MASILDWGVEVNLWFQQFSPALDPPFKAITFMGEDVFFMLLLPLLYWCVDRRTGARLIILFLFSAYVNAVAKVLAGQPRPFHYDPRVRRLVEAGEGGLPSGHTQSAVVVWGYLACRFRRAWFWVVAGVLMVLIPLSRVYLGVHFPTDLLGGYVLGAALLLLYLWLEPRAEAWLRGRGLAWQLGAALILSALLMLWFPTGERHGVTAGATLMGISFGLALERRWVGFETEGAWWRRVLRFALGAAVLFGLHWGLQAAFRSLEPALFFRFVRYLLMGLAGVLGVPWAFVTLRLAETRQSGSEGGLLC